MSDTPGDRSRGWATWFRSRSAYTDDYDRLTDRVAVATNRAGTLTAEQRRWYASDRIRSRVQDALWFGGSALAAACSGLGWFDRRLVLPCALLALLYGVKVIRRLKDDPLADDLNVGRVASASGGLEASKDTVAGGYSRAYYLAVRSIEQPYQGYRR